MTQLLCLGFNHLSSPLEMREKLIWTKDRLLAFMRDQVARNGYPEIAILCTCNRVEAYAMAANMNFVTLLDAWSVAAHVEPRQLVECGYQLAGESAVRHLFKVAAGLDSVVVGEHQILGQVASDYRLALSSGTAGKSLSNLFQAALNCGKRIQTQTTLNRLNSSIPSLAVKIVCMQQDDAAKSRVVVVGAGEMAELAIKAFLARGLKKITVVSRSVERAKRLAQTWGVETGEFSDLTRLLRTSDVLFSSTSAEEYIVTREQMKEVMRSRQATPLAIIDIAVPRDVDPEVGLLANVRLYDMADLEKMAAEMSSLQKRQIVEAERIVDEEFGKYINHLKQQSAVPVIKELRQQVEGIRKSELERSLRNMPHLDSLQKQEMERLTKSITKKILHQPTLQLKKYAANNGNDEIYNEWVRGLFGLKSE
ncbi:MAG: glutamyl-tRNA reductase [Anaerolineales bacterium]